MWRALEELEITVKDVDIHRDASARADLMANAGRATVPVLRIEGDADAGARWMPESADIVRYLYERFGDGKKPGILSMLTPMQKLIIGAGLAFVAWNLLA